MDVVPYSNIYLFVFRVRVPWWASAGLLPGATWLCNLPDDTHALVGGMQWSMPTRSLLCQPEDQAPQIHIWVQRWHFVQWRGGEEHQVRLCGLHVVQRREAERTWDREREKDRERWHESESIQKYIIKLYIMDNDICKIEDFFSPSVNSQRVYGVRQSQNKQTKTNKKYVVSVKCCQKNEQKKKKNGGWEVIRCRTISISIWLLLSIHSLGLRQPQSNKQRGSGFLG